MHQRGLVDSYFILTVLICCYNMNFVAQIALALAIGCSFGLAPVSSDRFLSFLKRFLLLWYLHRFQAHLAFF